MRCSNAAAHSLCSARLLKFEFESEAARHAERRSLCARVRTTRCLFVSFRFVPFRVLDTRTERTRRDVTGASGPRRRHRGIACCLAFALYCTSVFIAYSTVRSPPLLSIV